MGGERGGFAPEFTVRVMGQGLREDKAHGTGVEKRDKATSRVFPAHYTSEISLWPPADKKLSE